MPEHVVRWYQENSESVSSWEFQFLRYGETEWRWVYRVDPVDDCEECFEAIIELPDDAIFVRSKSTGSGGESVWSQRYPLPEPDFDPAIVLGVLWLSLIAWAVGRLR